MPDFLSLTDCTGSQLCQLLDRADALETAWRENGMPQSLAGTQIGLWFYGLGFRNRAAFEIGARAMGASVSYVPGELGIQDPLEDIGPYLDNWFSLIACRAKRHQDLLTLAGTMRAPIVNARTDFNHPCEILGDLQYIRQHRGSLEGLKVVFAGEVTNTCMSWMEAAVRLPITVTQVAPQTYLADWDLLDRLNASAVGRIATDDALEPHLSQADVLYTDCWPKSGNLSERKRIRRDFLPYQITPRHLALLPQKSVFLPCPPVTRGEEVSEEAMRSPLCQNHAAKACLLHAQNAVLEWALGV